MTTATRQKTDWLSIWLCFVAALMMVTHNGKIAGTMPLIQAELALSFTETGFLIAVFAGVAAFTGISFGRYLQRWPLWLGATGGLFLLAAGSFFASQTDSFTMLLFMRLLEGAGYMMGVTTLPQIMNAAAAPKDRTVTMAVWSCFVPASLTLSLIGTAYGVGFFGWRGIWEIAAGLCFLAGLLMFVRFGRGSQTDYLKEADQSDAGRAREPVRRILENPEIIMMALVFFFYAIMFQPAVSYLPSLFLENGDFGLQGGTMATALCLSVNVLGNLLVVPLLRRGFTIRQILIFSVTLNLLSCVLIFVTFLDIEYRLLAAIGFLGLSGLLPGIIWVRVGQISANRRQGQLFSAFVFQLTGLGQVCGPILFAWSVDKAGNWEGGIIWLVTAGLASIFIAIKNRPGSI